MINPTVHDENIDRETEIASRLSVCLAISVFMHLLVFNIPSGIQTTMDSTIISPSPRPPLTIELGINPKAIRDEKDSLASHLNDQGVTKNPKRSGATPTVSPIAIDDRPPELISNISSYIDFPITQGFIILELSISSDGEVSGAEVIYSELSQYATKRIAQRFAEATYRPASKHGHPENDTLLLKIDITP